MYVLYSAEGAGIMKTLILTCNTGQGHNSSAAAVKEVFVGHGLECDIADALGFFSKAASRLIEAGFTEMYKHVPKFFNFGYANIDKTIADKFFLACMAPAIRRMRNFILKNGYDNVISAHIFPTLMISEVMKKYGVRIKTSFVATDYTCYPFSEKSNLDIYFMPHGDLREEFLGRGLAEESLVEVGIPIRSEFLEKIDKDVARERLGLRADDKALLVMGGSMGCGPMKNMVLSLLGAADEGTKVIVVCGKNKKLYRAFKKLNSPALIPLGYVDNVPEIMAAADLFITKPGGISVTEAAVMGLPMLLLNYIGGCETHNYDFFIGHGLAFAAEDISGTSELCRELLAEPELLAEKSLLLKETICARAAENVYLACANLFDKE